MAFWMIYTEMYPARVMNEAHWTSWQYADKGEIHAKRP